MKKTHVLLTFLAVFYSLISLAQNGLVQIKAESGKWGYANLKGEEVIPAKFKNCNPFSSDGFAVVVLTSGYSIINVKGEEIPTEVHDYEIIQGIFGIGPKGFENGLLGIRSGKKWGYLNTSGKLAIPLNYDYITEFNGGYATARNGGRFIVLDTKGKETSLVSKDNIDDIKHFSEGLAPVRSSNGLFGFANTKAEIAIPVQFKSVGYFSGGLAWAKNTEGKAGFINPKGEWVIQPTYLDVTNFDPVSKFAKVKQESGWSYIDASGKPLVVSTTESWGDFSDGLAAGEQGGKKGFYNTKGEWVIKPQFEGVRKFENGYAAAKQGGKWGIIDASGNWVIKPVYSGINDVVLIK
ncbi:WG repeat-containing protein [Cytophaga hutchinsonii]|jgi:hypothetical protein|uniref:WG repeat-containing protein n=1 Tax=Cytophaga hutchinsonii TaxID=985 RepID=UPI000038F19D|nr:WG repeat-containing protein [Cytophaga hutchinsonii]SFX12980.1 WG containing repeat-containing protein [Cytophaga hutchinsonii ATCC 33406]